MNCARLVYAQKMLHSTRETHQKCIILLHCWFNFDLINKNFKKNGSYQLRKFIPKVNRWSTCQ